MNAADLYRGSRTTEETNANIAFGRRYERLVDACLQREGWTTVSLYSGNMPMLHGSWGSFVAPDILAFKHGEAAWFEVKQKNAPTFTRLTQQLETGIDAHCFRSYLAIKKMTGIPVYLVFLYEQTNEVHQAEISVLDAKKRQGTSTGLSMVYFPVVENERICSLSKL